MEWTKLEDEKPKDGVEVLLYIENSGVIQGSIDVHGGVSAIYLDLHGCGCCAGESDKATHWAELIIPPKD